MKNITYINAGAGAGKTYRLTHTFAELVREENCTPSQVIMTTFSKRAAADIKRDARLRFQNMKLYGPAAELDAANIGTVHAVAQKYIKKYWYLLGISAQCDVMTDDNKEAHIALTLWEATEAEDIAAFRKFAETVNLTDGTTKIDYGFWKVAVSGIISKADSMGISDLSESHKKSLERIDILCKNYQYYNLLRDCADRVFKIAIKWQDNFRKYKKDNAIIDYNDMESYFLDMLKDPKYKAVQDEIHESIRYVFVDEFQDSNPKQLEIFDRLSELVTASYWVGDPKQAIYGFRACDTELVQALTDSIRSRVKAKEPGFLTDRLDISRRSLKPLVDFANDVFVRAFPELDEDDVKLKSSFRTEELPKEVINIQHWDGALRPAKMTAKGKLGEPGIPNADQTIAGLASEIRRILDGKSEIKEVFDKETRELREIRASDIAVLCRTNGDVGKVASWFAQYGIPITIDGVADVDRMEIRLVFLMLNYILGDSKLLTAELSKLCCGLTLGEILGKDYDELVKLTAFLEEYRKDLSDKGVASVVRGLVIRMGLLDKCAKWGHAEDRRNNLMALVQNAREYEENSLKLGENATIEGFISRIEEGAIKVEGYATEGVHILTYHGSKGLQWPMVILYSLCNDKLSDNMISRSFLWDVQAVRKAKPSADNLYPGYYITYTPRLTNHPTAKVDDSIRNMYTSLSGPGNYTDFRTAQIKEGRRLLYVGVTRARDILVEVAQHGKNCAFISDAMRDIYGDSKWDAKTKKDWANETYQEIWGPGTPKIFYREMKEDDPPAYTPDSTYMFRKKEAPNGVKTAKKLKPSGLKDDELVARTDVICHDDDGQPFRQVIFLDKKDREVGEDEVGTCIHNVFAAYDPEKPRSEMDRMAADTIARHGLDGLLPKPGQIIDSIEWLCGYLAKKYGKDAKIEHELPFRLLRNGQMTVGSIDLVWYTSEKECVLVDFKNLPFVGKEDVITPGDKRYVGEYAPQQKAYSEALSEAGLTVRASIIYLAMQGKVIELRWK